MNWTEVPGSKLRFTSLVHIFLELAAIPLGYKSGLWPVVPAGQAAAALALGSPAAATDASAAAAAVSGKSKFQ